MKFFHYSSLVDMLAPLGFAQRQSSSRSDGCRIFHIIGIIRLPHH